MNILIYSYELNMMIKLSDLLSFMLTDNKRGFADVMRRREKKLSKLQSEASEVVLSKILEPYKEDAI
jgi:hypothetical protein